MNEMGERPVESEQPNQEAMVAHEQAPEEQSHLAASPRHQGGHGHGEGGHAHGEGGHAHGPVQRRGFVAAPRAHLPQNDPMLRAAPSSSTRANLEKGAGKGKVLFLDCPSGIAGDMTLAALLDLGLPIDFLEQTVAALGLANVELVIEQGHVGAIGACHVDVRVGGAQPSRSYRSIVRLIEQSPLEKSVKDLAQQIFKKLGEAEAEVHRQSLDTVEFHEVGSVDSIVDIVGAAALFDYLGAEVVASPLPLGRGFVNSQHGILPLPAPATLLCLAGVPTRPSGLEVELVTPTGAAIVATVASRFMDWPAISVERVGWGAGTRALADRPNALRAVLGVPNSQPVTDWATPSHALLEATIDDMTGELASFALERVLAAGALDVWLSAVTMKKSRPGLVLSVVARIEQAAELAQVVLRETTTIGVRQTPLNRYELVRKEELLSTPYGDVRVKVSGTQRRKKVEFDDCARIARATGLPMAQVVVELQALAERELD